MWPAPAAEVDFALARRTRLRQIPVNGCGPLLMQTCFHRLLLPGVLALGLAHGAAQTLPGRPKVQERIPVPRNPVPAPTAPAPAAPTISTLPFTPPAANSGVRIVPSSGFNLDTALARILNDAKLASAMGEFELSSTNAGRVELSRFPLWIHLREGQVRTELDIAAAPGHFGATGPFAAFRQEGITRLVSLTVANLALRKSYQLFPEKQTFVSRDLAPEDMPLLLQLQKQPLGPDTLDGAAADKWAMTLVYPNGDKRPTEVWVMNGIPRQIRLSVGDSRLTVRFREAQPAGAPVTKEVALLQARLFELPPDYRGFADAGDMLAMLSAKRVKTLR